MSRRRKPNLGNPRRHMIAPGSRRNASARNQLRHFMKELAEIGVPASYVNRYLPMMLNTDIPRQCACGNLHTDPTTLAYFQQAHTNTVVLWAKCPECVRIERGASQEVREEMEDIHTRRTLAWAQGVEQPEGVVFIFTFGRKWAGES